MSDQGQFVVEIKFKDEQMRQQLESLQKMMGNIGLGSGGSSNQQSDQAKKAAEQLDKLGKIRDEVSKSFKPMQDIAKNTLSLVGIGTSIGAIAALLTQASPLLNSTFKLIENAVIMTLRPIGDFIGTILRPVVLMFYKYFLIPFYQYIYPNMQKLFGLPDNLKSTIGIAQSIPMSNPDLQKQIDQTPQPDFWTWLKNSFLTFFTSFGVIPSASAQLGGGNLGLIDPNTLPPRGTGFGGSLFPQAGANLGNLDAFLSGIMLMNGNASNNAVRTPKNFSVSLSESLGLNDSTGMGLLPAGTNVMLQKASSLADLAAFHQYRAQNPAEKTPTQDEMQKAADAATAAYAKLYPNTSLNNANPLFGADAATIQAAKEASEKAKTTWRSVLDTTQNIGDKFTAIQADPMPAIVSQFELARQKAQEIADAFNSMNAQFGFGATATGGVSGGSGGGGFGGGGVSGGVRLVSGHSAGGIDLVAGAITNPPQSKPGQSHASGGLLTEPIIGFGLRTGRMHTFAEHGTEQVVPAGGGGRHIFNVHFNIAKMASEIDMRRLYSTYRRWQQGIMNRNGIV